MRPHTKIEEAALVIPADVGGAQKGKIGVFDFILIASSDAEFRREVAGLGVKTSAVVFERVSEREIAGEGRNRFWRQRCAEGIARVEEIGEMVVDEFAIIGFDAADGVMPVRAGGKIPPRVGAKKVQRVALIEIWRKKERLAGNTRVAIGVAQREA